MSNQKQAKLDASLARLSTLRELYKLCKKGTRSEILKMVEELGKAAAREVEANFERKKAAKSSFNRKARKQELRTVASSTLPTETVKEQLEEREAH